MKIILTYGTFDILHYGHINFLKKAKKFGDYLIVGLSTDKFNKIKGKNSYYPYHIRKKMLEELKVVDKVIPEKRWNQKLNDFKKYNADMIVIGEDWKNDIHFKNLNVKFLKRTPDISTTKIKKDITNF